MQRSVKLCVCHLKKCNQQSSKHDTWTICWWWGASFVWYAADWYFNLRSGSRPFILHTHQPNSLLSFTYTKGWERERERTEKPYQLVFKKAELEALESRSRHQEITKIQEIQRAHCLYDIDLFNQKAQDFVHPVHVVIDPANVFLCYTSLVQRWEGLHAINRLKQADWLVGLPQAQDFVRTCSL